MNIYVLDTSAIIQDPLAFLSYPDGMVVVPDKVIEKLMYLESDTTNRLRALAARTALKFIEELTESHASSFNISNEDNDIPLPNGSIFKVISTQKNATMKKVSTSDSLQGLISQKYFSIIQATMQLAERNPKDTVKIVTTDTALTLTARHAGVESITYQSDVTLTNIYEAHKGHTRIYVPKELVDLTYENKNIPVSELAAYTDLEKIYPNTFVNLVDSCNTSNTALLRVKRVHGELCLTQLLINKEAVYFGIKWKDSRQLMALELLLDPSVPLVTLIGKSGTGKTLLALAAALHQTLESPDKTYKRIMLLRSISEVGDNAIGFLPGEKDEKLSPFMAPFFDNLEFLYENQSGSKTALQAEVILESLEGVIRMESVGFLRGRTLPNHYVICDEVQNMTMHEVKTLVTRIGDGGKVILMGDPEQIDNRFLDVVNNGLVYISEKMKTSDLSGTIHLDGKSQRSPLAEEASKLLI